MGLINLAFLLLGVPRTRPTSHSCWSHGKLILVRLSKAQPETAGYILSELSDRIAMDVTNRQYAGNSDGSRPSVPSTGRASHSVDLALVLVARDVDTRASVLF